MISPPWPSPANRDSRPQIPGRPAPPAARLPQNVSSADNEPALRFVPESPRARLGSPLPPGDARRKGPGQRLRTGVRPVRHGLGPRCLLGARALSRPNPPSSRMNAASPSCPSCATPGPEAAGCGRPCHGIARTDRQSTRLNSSHVRISYAVFCLKKKKLIYYGRYLIKKQLDLLITDKQKL